MKVLALLSVAALAMSGCSAPDGVGDKATAGGDPATDAAPTPTPMPVEPDGGIGDGAGPPLGAGEAEEPSAFAQSFPTAIRGTWRATGGAPVSKAQCDGYLPENMGKVLTIREDSYSFFEQGGRLISVSEREPGLIRGVFDTTYADTPTRDELEFSVDPVAKTLSVRNFDTGERATTMYRRCPR